MARQPFCEMAAAGARKFAPWLFTSTSSRPSSRTTLPTALTHWSSSRTSHWTASCPAFSDGLREAIATRAPASTNASQSARPMPPAPPVTRTTRPDRSGILRMQLLGAVLEIGQEPGQRLLGERLLDESRHQRAELEIDGVGGVGRSGLGASLEDPAPVVALHHL